MRFLKTLFMSIALVFITGIIIMLMLAVTGAPTLSDYQVGYIVGASIMSGLMNMVHSPWTELEKELSGDSK